MAEPQEANMKDRTFRNLFVVFWAILIVGLICGADIVSAGQSQPENQGGVAYGSAVNKDTSYVSWNSKTYVDLYNYDSFDIMFKVLAVTSDTVVIRTLGSNAKADTLQYYDLIRADTVLQASMGDSIVHITLPYGTASPTTVLPRFIKMEIFLYDADAGGAAQATVTDSWMAR